MEVDSDRRRGEWMDAVNIGVRDGGAGGGQLPPPNSGSLST